MMISFNIGCTTITSTEDDKFGEDIVKFFERLVALLDDFGGADD